MTSGHKAGLGPLARWAVLATTLAMVAALLANSWANLRAVDEASETLHRGQGEPLLAAVHQTMARHEGPPPVEALEALLELHHPAGLRYVALLGHDGAVLVEAGQRIVDLDRGRSEQGPPVSVRDHGSRIVMRSDLRRGGPGEGPPRDGDRRLDPRRPRRPPGGRPPRGRPPGGRPEDRRPTPAVVLEFEPVVVSQLSRRAMRSFAFSALAGAFLVATAAVFWRLIERREKAERREEHERRLRALGEMSAVMAHELRNPLASLKGNAQILAERLPEDGRERRKAERVVEDAKRLESLCQALLDFCHTRPLERRPVDPVALVREAAAHLEEGSKIAVDGAGAPERWSLDPLRMHQVLLNLLDNARQASPEGEAVDVRVARRNGRLEIAIRDRGQGIAPGGEERLFEPFFTTRTRGIGLGLSVARRMVELHGGSLDAGNAADGGAEFRISIPGGE